MAKFALVRQFNFVTDFKPFRGSYRGIYRSNGIIREGVPLFKCA